MMLSVNIADATSQSWVTCFQESAEAILGRSAQELGTLREQSPERFEAALNVATFGTFMWKCRAKAETYMDESRVKVSAVEVVPVNAVAEAKFLVRLPRVCLFSSFR
jgi:replication factor A1